MLSKLAIFGHTPKTENLPLFAARQGSRRRWGLRNCNLGRTSSASRRQHVEYSGRPGSERAVQGARQVHAGCAVREQRWQCGTTGHERVRERRLCHLSAAGRPPSSDLRALRMESSGSPRDGSTTPSRILLRCMRRQRSPSRYAVRVGCRPALPWGSWGSDADNASQQGHFTFPSWYGPVASPLTRRRWVQPGSVRRAPRCLRRRT